MKRGTPEHFKTMRLADELGCSRPEAMGLLEGLWHFTARSAPQGDIGRCTNREIARGCYSERDGDELVRAFIAAGWLDTHEQHRLVVHDWHDHAEEAVKKLLERRRLPFLSLSAPRRDMSRRRRDMSGAPGETCRAPARGSGYGKGKGSGKEGECRGETVEALRDAWNEHAPQLPRCVELNAARRRHGAARLQERPIAEWVPIIRRMNASAFCRGEAEHSRGWRADFDFLLQPGTAAKVLEGKYDDRTPAHDPDAPSPMEVVRRLREKAQAR